jgi:hypothetical protein
MLLDILDRSGKSCGLDNKCGKESYKLENLSRMAIMCVTGGCAT